MGISGRRRCAELPPWLALPPAASGAVCVYTVMVLSWWALGAIWSNSVPATTAAAPPRAALLRGPLSSCRVWFPVVAASAAEHGLSVCGLQ